MSNRKKSPFKSMAELLHVALACYANYEGSKSTNEYVADLVTLWDNDAHDKLFDEMNKINKKLNPEMYRAAKQVVKVEMRQRDEDDNDVIYPWESFRGACKRGTFVDDDGYGEFATATMTSGVSVTPSQAADPKFKKPKWATHVVWYNK